MLKFLLLLIASTSAAAFDLESMREQCRQLGVIRDIRTELDAIIVLEEARKIESAARALDCFAALIVDVTDDTVAQAIARTLFLQSHDHFLSSHSKKLIHWLLQGHTGQDTLRRLLSSLDRGMQTTSIAEFKGTAEQYRNIIAALPSKPVSLKNKLTDGLLINIWVLERDPALLLERAEKQLRVNQGNLNESLTTLLRSLWAYGDSEVHKKVIEIIVRGHRFLLKKQSASRLRQIAEFEYRRFVSEHLWPRSEVSSILVGLIEDSNRKSANAARLLFKLDPWLALPLIDRGQISPTWDRTADSVEFIPSPNSVPQITVADIEKQFKISFSIRSANNERLTKETIHQLLEIKDNPLINEISYRIREFYTFDYMPMDFAWMKHVFDIARLCEGTYPREFRLQNLQPLIELALGHPVAKVRNWIIAELAHFEAASVALLIASSVFSGEYQYRALESIQRLESRDQVVRALLLESVKPGEFRSAIALWYADQLDRPAAVTFIESLFSSLTLVPEAETKLTFEANESVARPGVQKSKAQSDNGKSQTSNIEKRAEAFTKAVHLTIANALRLNPNPQFLGLLHKYGTISRFMEVRETAEHALRIEQFVTRPENLVSSSTCEDVVFSSKPYADVTHKNLEWLLE